MTSIVPAEAVSGHAGQTGRTGQRGPHGLPGPAGDDDGAPGHSPAPLAPRARLFPSLAAVYRAQLSRARVARIPLLFVATFQSVGIMVLMRGVVDGAPRPVPWWPDPASWSSPSSR